MRWRGEKYSSVLKFGQLSSCPVIISDKSLIHLGGFGMGLYWKNGFRHNLKAFWRSFKTILMIPFFLLHVAISKVCSMSWLICQKASWHIAQYQHRLAAVWDIQSNLQQLLVHICCMVGENTECAPILWVLSGRAAHSRGNSHPLYSIHVPSSRGSLVDAPMKSEKLANSRQDCRQSARWSFKTCKRRRLICTKIP